MSAGDVLEIEVIGVQELGADGPTGVEVEELCTLALSSAGIGDGHVAVEFVDEDGVPAGPRELGDIVICPEHTEDLREAVVHGALHLSGMDHERDEGEMLALQAELMRWVR